MTDSSNSFLNLHVVPNAPRSEVIGRHGHALKIKLHAPAVDNKANAELVRFLAAQLEISPASIQIVRGQKSREKVVAFTTLAVAEAETRLLATAKS